MKAKRFFRLNAWAFALDAVAGILVLALFAVTNAFLRIALALAALLVSVQALKLHNLYGDRKRTLAILTERNRQDIRLDTFSPFMRAPCGRMIVRQALEELGSSGIYRQMKRDFPFISLAKLHDDSGLEIVPYPETEVNHDELRSGGLE